MLGERRRGRVQRPLRETTCLSCVFPGNARQMPHDRKLCGKHRLSCAFYHTHDKQSLSCVRDGARQKKAADSTPVLTSNQQSGQQSLSCTDHGNARQSKAKNIKKEGRGAGALQDTATPATTNTTAATCRRSREGDVREREEREQTSSLGRRARIRPRATASTTGSPVLGSPPPPGTPSLDRLTRI